MAQWPCEGTLCRGYKQHGNFEGYLLPF